MISKHKYKNLTWIDLENPNRDEISSLAEEYKIPELVEEELLLPAIRSKVDRHENSIFMILHFPTIKKRGQANVIQEIDFFVGKDFLITAHYEPFKPLHDFAKLFEPHNTVLSKSDLGAHAGALLYILMKELYIFSANELDEITNYMDKIEYNIFDNKEREMVRYISEVNRKLLDFKQSMRFHRDVLTSFQFVSRDFFGGNFEYHASIILGEYNKVENMLEGHRDILTDLRDTNDSLLTNKTNDTMRVLTIITFLISPITVISSVFMMNTSFSLIRNVQEFYFVIGAMVLTSVITFIYKKKKKWL